MLSLRKWRAPGAAGLRKEHDMCSGVSGECVAEESGWNKQAHRTERGDGEQRSDQGVATGRSVRIHAACGAACLRRHRACV